MTIESVNAAADRPGEPRHAIETVNSSDGIAGCWLGKHNRPFFQRLLATCQEPGDLFLGAASRHHPHDERHRVIVSTAGAIAIHVVGPRAYDKHERAVNVVLPAFVLPLSDDLIVNKAPFRAVRLYFGGKAVNVDSTRRLADA